MKIKVNKNLIKALLFSSVVLTASNKVQAANMEDIIDVIDDYSVINTSLIERDIPGLPKKAVLKATTNINVRKDKDTNSEIIGGLNENDTVDFLGYENGWYKVKYNGESAYVCADYVSQTFEIDLPSKCDKIVMALDDINIYSTPSYENPITNLLTYESAEVYQETNGFYLAKADGVLGYIPVDFVTDLDTRIVVVDISDQLLKLYKDNEIYLISDVVTGKTDTPSDIGLYNIYSKEQSRYLTGPGYSSYVNYWMPYNGGEGLHDATWRYEFGGDIYTWGGSHGCVNLPLDIAEEIYNNVDVGTQVLVKR